MMDFRRHRLNQSLFALTILIEHAYSQCPTLPVGSSYQEPDHYYSANGLLDVRLEYLRQEMGDGTTQFCYLTQDGVRSPILHLKQGDRFRITLTNLVPPSGNASDLVDGYTNLHFHGMEISPALGQDFAITVIAPGETFLYDIAIPSNHPVGQFWYHPHYHGTVDVSMLGGASGQIFVDGIENALPAVAGLPVRCLAFRDYNLPGPTNVDDVEVVYEGEKRPSWDVTLNFIPIPYPNYTTVKMQIAPNAKEFWRVINAGADSVLNLTMIYDGVPQTLYVVAMDGMLINAPGGILPMTSLFIPPARRYDFFFYGPAPSVREGLFVTQMVKTGPLGDDDPYRPLVSLIPTLDANPPALALPTSIGTTPVPHMSVQQLYAVTPMVYRKLYFSEVVSDPTNPQSKTDFYITVEGQKPVTFEDSLPPAIVTHQGSIEEWTITNRAQEVHEFHIHQTHFIVTEVNGAAVPLSKMQYLDTAHLDYWNGTGPYPYVKFRIDFSAVSVGTFVYHCHLLGHEDNGMMAKIQVLPWPTTKPPSSTNPQAPLSAGARIPTTTPVPSAAPASSRPAVITTTTPPGIRNSTASGLGVQVTGAGSSENMDSWKTGTIVAAVAAGGLCVALVLQTPALRRVFCGLGGEAALPRRKATTEFAQAANYHASAPPVGKYLDTDDINSGVVIHVQPSHATVPYHYAEPAYHASRTPVPTRREQPKLWRDDGHYDDNDDGSESESDGHGYGRGRGRDGESGSDSDGQRRREDDLKHKKSSNKSRSSKWHQDRDKGRDRDRDRKRNKSRNKDRDRDRDLDQHHHKDRYSQRDRERVREHDRERDRDQDRDRDRDRDPNRDRDRDRDRDHRDRDRDRDYARKSKGSTREDCRHSEV